MKEKNEGSVEELISQLQQFDNPKGYRLEYETVKEKLAPAVAQLIQKGEAALNQLHELLQYEESWSCAFTLEALKGIKSEKSIHYLIEFIKKNENGDYFESCDEALWALQAIGRPAVEPLLKELKNEFANNNFFGYLVGALTGIKDYNVYSFMVEITEDCLKNPEKYEDWFEIDAFTYGFTEQGKKEALPLLRRVLAADLSEEEKREIESTIEALEDPEGFNKKIEAEAEILQKEFEKEQEKQKPGSTAINENESVKVNCDFCGKGMECPPDMMKKAKKHMCHECFHKRAEEGEDENGLLEDVHVDIPTDELISEVASNMTDSLVNEVFHDMWAEKKDELKELSKKELAYEMFCAGAYNAINQMIRMQRHHMRDLKDNGKRKARTDRIR